MSKFFAPLVATVFLLAPAAGAEAYAPADVLSLVNAERRAGGLPELRSNTLLERAAAAKARDMMAKGYFDHVGPDGSQFYSYIDNEGYRHNGSGENLAMSAGSAQLAVIVRSWMDSPLHRANIMNGAYTETGIGVATGMYKGRQTTFIVEMFATPAAELAKAAQPVTYEIPNVVTTIVPKVEAKTPAAKPIALAEQKSEVVAGATLMSEIQPLERSLSQVESPRLEAVGWRMRLKIRIERLLTRIWPRVYS